MKPAPITAAVACLPLLLAAARPMALFRDALHGKWAATVVPDDMNVGAKQFKDVITFSLGDLFASDELSKQGYEPTTYKDRGSPIGVAAKFEVTQTNKAGDTAAWTGAEAGGELTGSLVLTPKGGVPVTYTFKAEKK